jgi:hypothetical protein
MRTLLKPFGLAAMALVLLATAVTDAEAGRRHRNGNGKFIAGLATGIIAGAIIHHATRPRHHNNYYYSSGPSYPSYEPVCYRGAPRCHTRWDCWVNSWGREVCERVERCNRPLICE